MAQNRCLTGSTGNVWLNGQLLAQVKSIEAKITGNFEEVNFVGDYATHNAYTGWSGEGTLTLQKIDSAVLKLVSDSFKTGVFPEIKIITQLKDQYTGKSERVFISDVLSRKPCWRSSKTRQSLKKKFHSNILRLT